MIHERIPEIVFDVRIELTEDPALIRTYEYLNFKQPKRNIYLFLIPLFHLIHYKFLRILYRYS